MHNVEILKGPYKRQAAKHQIEQWQEISQVAEKFWQKLSEIKAVEMAKKKAGKEYNPHFENMNPDELNETDAKIYAKFENDTLTFNEFNNTRNEANMSVLPGEDPYENSRTLFYAYLGNLTISSKEWRDRWGLRSPKH